MAASSEMEKIISPFQIKFMGPAQKEFDTIEELSVYFLNTFWPQWKSYDDPQNYLIRSTFKYKHSEINDESFEKFQREEKNKKSKNPHEILSDRIGDEAEFIVYDTIRKMIDHRIHTPFIAFHGLDLFLNLKDGNVHGRLTTIFPQVKWPNFKELMRQIFSKETANIEYDFILIGPKIGIVVIEVKGSDYNRAQDFKRGHKSLPDGYGHALAQLESSKALIQLVEEITNVKMSPEIGVRKILVAPNLERARYNEWMASLKIHDQNYVTDKIHGIIQIFKEDVVVDLENIQKSRLYLLLEKAVENSGRISNEIYEAYAPLLAAIASITVLPSLSRGISQIVELDKLNFSEYDIAIEDGKAISDQNLLADPSTKLTSHSTIVRIPKEMKKFSNVFLLSPDQLKILTGPNRQLILGAAGTGKTIVLQTKAVELLTKGESVLILAAQNYKWRYKHLFDSYGFKNYEISDLGNNELPVDDTFEDYLNELGVDIYSIGLDALIQNIDHHFMQSHIDSKLTKELRSIFKYGNVIIDDALDDNFVNERYNIFITAVLLLMTYNKKELPNGCIWAAIDPHIPYHAGKNYRQWLEDLVKQKERNAFTVGILKHVMRCSRNVFDYAYDSAIHCPLEARPVLGHKIQGIIPTRIIEHYLSIDDAMSALWERIEGQIVNLINQEINFADVAIVILPCDLDEQALAFIRKQCKRIWPHLINKPNLIISDHNRILTPEKEIFIDKNLLTMTKWDEVSSLEWPIIISVYMALAIGGVSEAFKYGHYRGRSRATAKLVDISFTYEEDILEEEREDQTEEEIMEEIELEEQNQSPQSVVPADQTGEESRIEVTYWTPKDAYLLINLCSKFDVDFNFNPEQNNENFQLLDVWQKIHAEFNASNVEMHRNFEEIKIKIIDSRRAATNYAEACEKSELAGYSKPSKPPSWIYRMFEIMYK